MTSYTHSINEDTATILTPDGTPILTIGLRGNPMAECTITSDIHEHLACVAQRFAHILTVEYRLKSTSTNRSTDKITYELHHRIDMQRKPIHTAMAHLEHDTASLPTPSKLMSTVFNTMPDDSHLIFTTTASRISVSTLELLLAV